MLLNVTLILFSTIFAFWISAICGGGASLILLPLLSLMLPISLVPFSLTVGTFSSSVSRIVIFRKSINWKIFFWFVPFSIPAVLLGAWLMIFLNPIYLQFFIGIFLIVNIGELFRSKKEQVQNEKPFPNYYLAIVGFLAGFVSGVTGAIGLLFNRLYFRYGLTKEEIVATRAANEIFLHSIKLIIYIELGLYSTPAFWLGVVIAIGALISAITVKYILPYLSEYTFRKIGYGAMVLSGFILLFSTSQKIIIKDNISLSVETDETTIKWRQSNLDLEYSFEDGIVLKRGISQNELPENLKLKYFKFTKKYDKVFLKKVFKFGKKPSYKFNLYKNNIYTKFEYDV